MKAVEQKAVRFYANNPKDKEAWNNLHHIDKEVYPTQQEFVIDAINNQFKRMQDIKEDPYLENREREEDFIRRITKGVEEQLVRELPHVVGGFLMGLLAKGNDANEAVGRKAADDYRHGKNGTSSINDSDKSELASRTSDSSADTSKDVVEENNFLEMDNFF